MLKHLQTTKRGSGLPLNLLLELGDNLGTPLSPPPPPAPPPSTSLGMLLFSRTFSHPPPTEKILSQLRENSLPLFAALTKPRILHQYRCFSVSHWHPSSYRTQLLTVSSIPSLLQKAGFLHLLFKETPTGNRNLAVAVSGLLTRASDIGFLQKVRSQLGFLATCLGFSGSELLWEPRREWGRSIESVAIDFD